MENCPLVNCHLFCIEIGEFTKQKSLKKVKTAPKDGANAPPKSQNNHNTKFKKKTAWHFANILTPQLIFYTNIVHTFIHFSNSGSKVFKKIPPTVDTASLDMCGW